jgi:hypothetical protein
MTWEQIFMEDYSKRKEEKRRMKLTHGYDETLVVGEVYLSKEIYDAVLRGVDFRLGATIRQGALGPEIVGLSLVPLPVAPVTTHSYRVDL